MSHVEIRQPVIEPRLSSDDSKVGVSLLFGAVALATPQTRVPHTLAQGLGSKGAGKSCGKKSLTC